ncbi:ClpXP protease specificity-enhancing factor [Halomonas sp. 18H]|uniref:ClpXP protease specificity-enhancing factor n=1 Tax=Halomonas almeriensis TaxID=308163 RepID=UPI002232A1A1|nr:MULTISPECIES: ClpXP protease specificity-enhancing factor [Halomonas]MCW4151649.1 ClpXP protease specificity-enhancing factor [Halomonas sp. 18H]MDN3552786.1 ClpXP protease specificity-enhancing factor [Halomonas almeriensis]
MHSSRPYIARALYQWLLDNDLTPHVVVDAEKEGVEVPRDAVQNGQIVLNLGVSAIRDLSMENDAIAFSARFDGKPTQLMVPMEALIAIYARENGVGMVFGHEPEMPEEEESEAPQAEQDETGPALASVDDTADTDGDSHTDEGQAPKKARPSLRVVK